MLSITVANTAGEMDTAQRCADGIGLANVRERLSEHHGAAQSVAVSAGPDLFEVRITLPMGSRDDRVQHPHGR
jgi:LytS/YehU family sensor histidine kinase